MKLRNLSITEQFEREIRERWKAVHDYMMPHFERMFANIEDRGPIHNIEFGLIPASGTHWDMGIEDHGTQIVYDIYKHSSPNDRADIWLTAEFDFGEPFDLPRFRISSPTQFREQIYFLGDIPATGDRVLASLKHTMNKIDQQTINILTAPEVIKRAIPNANIHLNYDVDEFAISVPMGKHSGEAIDPADDWEDTFGNPNLDIRLKCEMVEDDPFLPAITIRAFAHTGHMVSRTAIDLQRDLPDLKETREVLQRIKDEIY